MRRVGGGPTHFADAGGSGSWDPSGGGQEACAMGRFGIFFSADRKHVRGNPFKPGDRICTSSRNGYQSIGVFKF